jgi:hypothetical protein
MPVIKILDSKPKKKKNTLLEEENEVIHFLLHIHDKFTSQVILYLIEMSVTWSTTWQC